MKKVSMKDIDNLYFWVNYFGCSYPNAYDEEEEVSASDIMQEMLTEEGGRWWAQFPGFYDGILEQNDGYLDEPATLEVMMAQDKYAKIEFHPGDTLYYINGEKIGSTGPHWEIRKIPYEEVRQLLALENGCQLYLLFLPLAVIRPEETDSVRREIGAQMGKYFPESLCRSVSGCIAAGLAQEGRFHA